MSRGDRANTIPLLLSVALLSWLVPGAGHFLLKERKRAAIIFVAITATFCIGLFIGSVAVVNPVSAKPWYYAQIMASPVVAVFGHLTAVRGLAVYAWTNEIGQIYTSTAGLLNLLCIVNAVYLAYVGPGKAFGD